jgi:hypothetical protein
MDNRSKEKKAQKRLGEMLLEGGHIDELQLAVALGKQREQGLKLGALLLKLGFVAERTLAEILKQQLGIQWISLFDREIPREVVEAIPLDIALKYTVMPVLYDGKTITIAIANPSDLETIDSLIFQLGKKIKPLMALETDIEKAIIRHYKPHDESSARQLKEKISKLSEEAKRFDVELAPQTERMIDPEVTSRKEPAPTKTKAVPAPDLPPETPGTVRKKITLDQALISLLIRKKIISKDELLDELLRLDRGSDDE